MLVATAAIVVAVATVAVVVVAVAVVAATTGAGGEDLRAATMISLLALAICYLVSVATRTHMPW